MKYIRIITLTLITILISNGAIYSQSPEEEMHLRGINYCVNGDFKSAKVAFENALLLDSTYIQSRNCLAVVRNLLLKLLKTEFGIQYFKTVSMINNTPLEQVVEGYSKAIEIEPNYFYAYYSRALIYEAMGKYEEAMKDYSKSIWLNPMHADSYIGRGNTFGNLDLSDKAIEDYTKAIKLDPKSAIAFYNRGRQYSYAGKLKQAIDDYKSAIHINPGYAAAYYNRGTIYLKEGHSLML